MKNIKYIAVLLLQFAVLQFTFGQADALNNGRQTPSPAQETAVDSKTNTTSASKDVPNTSGFFIDHDVASAEKVATSPDEDTYYPVDLEISREEIMASAHPAVVAQKINDLSKLVDDLQKMTEELRLENKTIRESLSNCCSSSQLGLTADDAYLLQNTPNPFSESAEIQYFVPSDLGSVEISIHDLKGSVLNTIKIEEAGYGKIAVNANDLSSGTFVYTLSVNGQIVDSKVMIRTNK